MKGSTGSSQRRAELAVRASIRSATLLTLQFKVTAATEQPREHDFGRHARHATLKYFASVLQLQPQLRHDKAFVPSAMAGQGAAASGLALSSLE